MKITQQEESAASVKRYLNRPLDLENLRINMKIHIRSLDDQVGHVMTIVGINGVEITGAKKFRGRGPEGGPGFRFTFYIKGAGYFVDGTGKQLLVKRFHK